MTCELYIRSFNTFEAKYILLVSILVYTAANNVGHNLSLLAFEITYNLHELNP